MHFNAGRNICDQPQMRHCTCLHSCIVAIDALVAMGKSYGPFSQLIVAVSAFK